VNPEAEQEAKEREERGRAVVVSEQILEQQAEGSWLKPWTWGRSKKEGAQVQEKTPEEAYE
jgi:hypothetical protein